MLSLAVLCSEVCATPLLVLDLLCTRRWGRLFVCVVCVCVCVLEGGGGEGLAEAKTKERRAMVTLRAKPPMGGGCGGFNLPALGVARNKV